MLFGSIESYQNDPRALEAEPTAIDDVEVAASEDAETLTARTGITREFTDGNLRAVGHTIQHGEELNPLRFGPLPETPDTRERPCSDCPDFGERGRPDQGRDVTTRDGEGTFGTESDLPPESEIDPTLATVLGLGAALLILGG